MKNPLIIMTLTATTVLYWVSLFTLGAAEVVHYFTTAAVSAQSAVLLHQAYSSARFAGHRRTAVSVSVFFFTIANTAVAILYWCMWISGVYYSVGFALLCAVAVFIVILVIAKIAQARDDNKDRPHPGHHHGGH